MKLCECIIVFIDQLLKLISWFNRNFPFNELATIKRMQARSVSGLLVNISMRGDRANFLEPQNTINRHEWVSVGFFVQLWWRNCGR